MPKLIATNADAFPRAQVGGLLFLGNLFNGQANGNPDELQNCIDIPTDGNGCLISTQPSGPCTISFRGQGTRENSGGVQGFPHALLGSLGGRFETWGVECGDSRILPGSRDADRRVSPVYDLQIASDAVGYPAQVGALPETVMTIDASDCGDPGNYNHFFCSYWHDTTQRPPSGGNYSGTINGINGRVNRLWNLNIWPWHPDIANITQWTGGEILDTGVIIGGRPHTIVAKHETGGNSTNFFYVGVVLEQPTKKVSLRYNDYADYLLSNNFWNTVQGSPFALGIIADIATGASNGFSLNAIRPNTTMFVDGIGGGNEVWGTRDGGDAETAICYNELSFTVDGVTYGKGDQGGSPGQTGQCVLPILFAPSSSVGCQLPINFNIGCRLPINFNGEGCVLADIDCNNCPAPEVTPRVTLGYGSQAVSIGPERFVNFRNIATVRTVDAVGTGLSGALSVRDTGVSYTPPATGTDIECGKIKLFYEYNCTFGGSTDVISCSLEIDVCTIPEVSQLPSEEITGPTGSRILIAANPSPAGDTPVAPYCAPPVGDLVWNGAGWEFVYPDGLVGRFEVIVPSDPYGDQAINTQRCVTICLTTDRQISLSERNCYSALAILDKSGKYVPVAKITAANLSTDVLGAEESVDFETGETCISDVDAQTFQLQVTGNLTCGYNPLQSGCVVDFCLIKDYRYSPMPKFFGRATTRGFNTGLTGGQKTFTLTMIGQGRFWAENWSY